MISFIHIDVRGSTFAETVVIKATDEASDPAQNVHFRGDSNATNGRK